MAGDWVVTSLRDAGVSLIDCDHRTPSGASSGYPYVAIPQLRDGRLELGDARLISPEDFIEWTRKARPQADDVVLSRRCNPGVTAFVPPDVQFALGQNLVLLRADPQKMHPPFLRWLVRSAHWWEQVERFRNVGAVFDSLKCADVPNFRLPIPPVDQQRRIASALQALDDKIDLNRRMNETLEATARAIFKSWFVDFDPSRETANKDHMRVPVAIREWFSSDLDATAAGDIPAGWRLRPLDSVATFLNGLALQRFPAVDELGLPVVKIRELNQGHTFGADRASSRIPAAYVVGDGDVLFSWSGSLVAKLWTGGRGALNQHLFKVTSSEFPKWFCFHWLLEHLGDFQAIAAGKATTMGHIQRHHLTEALVPVPPEPLLKIASSFMEPLLDRQIINGVQSRTLAMLRDVAMTKLLSGEIHLPDAEQVVEAAV